MKDFEKKARAYALKNAISHDGEATLGPVVAGLFADGLKKSEVKKYSGKLNKILEEVNDLSMGDQFKEFEKLKGVVSERVVREGLPELPGAKKGKVVMRFSPAPSGPFHVGNALTASISYLYVKKYNGKFYVRIEDTNPENIHDPAYKMIEDESNWLFEGNAKIIIQSGRMDLYYKYAEELIKKGKAYVCTCSSDEFKKYVAEQKETPCSKNSVEKNLENWQKMLDRDREDAFQSGEAVLRFKSGMKHKNPAMRDFPLARINEKPHPLQGRKYRVWPLMNLAVTVDDIELGMTHIIRAKEHRDNAERQKMIYDVLGKKFPWVGFLGRIHFKGLEMSTTMFRRAIESNKYRGWDDENLPTIAALRKKGYKASAFWKFAERIGLNENDKIIDKKEFFLLLDGFNRE